LARTQAHIKRDRGALQYGTFFLGGERAHAILKSEAIRWRNLPIRPTILIVVWRNRDLYCYSLFRSCPRERNPDCLLIGEFRVPAFRLRAPRFGGLKPAEALSERRRVTGRADILCLTLRRHYPAGAELAYSLLPIRYCLFAIAYSLRANC
jgi:hypothetical protein